MSDFSERVRSQIEAPREISPLDANIKILGGKALLLVSLPVMEVDPTLESLAVLTASTEDQTLRQMGIYPVGILPVDIAKWAYGLSELNPPDSIERKDQLMEVWETLTWMKRKVEQPKGIYLIDHDANYPDKTAQSIADAAAFDRYAIDYDRRVARLIETVKSIHPLVNELHAYEKLKNQQRIAS